MTVVKELTQINICQLNEKQTQSLTLIIECFIGNMTLIYQALILMQGDLSTKNARAGILRSTSEVIKTHPTSPKNKKIISNNFRRRSLIPKNVRIDEEGMDNPPLKPVQTMTELRFLADIVKKKQQPVITSNIQQGVLPKKSIEYEYYDSIVRDLISQIRNRSTRETAPVLSVGKAHKFSSTGSIHIRSPRKDRASDKLALIKVIPNKEKMTFSLSLSGSDTIYQKKITSYIEFLYKLNFANCLYVDLSLSKPKKYRVKIGFGNNGSLIKSLIKRRFWLEIVSSGQYHFSWTQLTDNYFHESQFLAEKEVEHAKNKPLSKRPKLLRSSAQDQLLKILRKEQLPIVNQWYQRSDCGKLSCYPGIQVSKVSNHIPLNCIIGAKRILFRVIDWYYREYLEKNPFDILPKTFSFQGDYTETMKAFTVEAKKEDKVWIVKPGQNTNRGNGIRVMQTKQVFSFLSRERVRDGKPFIVQQYIKPFLYNGRKFDIRHFLLVTSVNGFIRAYWYQQGYIRTSSQKYDIEDLSDQMIHLTNDAVQKRGDRYGKYQPANKLSYSNFQRYLDTTYPHKHYNFQTQILQKMKQITTDLIRASFQFIDPLRKSHNFQLFGLDFYISSKFKPYLIECNANPCLEVNCPILQKIIPGAVEHALRLGLDPLLPPPNHYPPAARYHLCDRVIEKLKYQLIFDEKIEGPSIRERSRRVRPLDLVATGLKPQEDVFQDDGSELDEGANID